MVVGFVHLVAVAAVSWCAALAGRVPPAHLTRRAPPVLLSSQESPAPTPSNAPTPSTVALRELLPTLRGSALTKATRAAAGAPPAALTSAFARLETAGLRQEDLGRLLARRPTAMRALLDGGGAQVAELLERLSGLGASDVGAIVCAQPRVLALDASRLDSAVAFLERYVGRLRVGEFVQLHPQSLLWRDSEDLPVVQHLRALGLSRRAIERVRDALPTIDRIASADNVAAVLQCGGAPLT